MSRKYMKWETFPSMIIRCPLCNDNVPTTKVGYMNDYRAPDRYRCSKCLLLLRPKVLKYYRRLYNLDDHGDILAELADK